MSLGRNDKCYCGSGKKYKKCHLDLDKLPNRMEKNNLRDKSEENLKNIIAGDRCRIVAHHPVKVF